MKIVPATSRRLIAQGKPDTRISPDGDHPADLSKNKTDGSTLLLTREKE